jgi:hypothetical protein
MAGGLQRVCNESGQFPGDCMWITGELKAPSGTPLEGVTLEIASPALNDLRRRVITGPRGAFRVGDLPQGIYSVEAIGEDGHEVLRESIDLTDCLVSVVYLEVKHPDHFDTRRPADIAHPSTINA